MWEEIREIRLIRAKRLLSNLKHQMNGILWFLSYEKKNKDQDQKVNRQSDKMLCRDMSQVQWMMIIKIPAIKGDNLPSHIFPRE